MKKIFLLLVIFMISENVYCQKTDKNVSLEWIIKVTNYRDVLLRRNTESLYELRSLLTKWDSLGVDQKEKIDFRNGVLVVGAANEWPYKLIMKRVNKYMPNSKISKTFTEDDLDVIKKNSELLDLIFLGVLTSEYPFKIDPTTGFFEELEYYGLKEGMKIGEIGAGTGMFSLLMKLLSKETEMYINELDIGFINYISETLEKNEEILGEGFIYLVKGSRKSTKFEGCQLDKLIIRNTLHHFSSKKRMLASIKKTLKENGELYLHEAILELDTNNNVCKEALSKAEILTLMRTNGFELIDETERDESIIFKFKVKK